jgi:aspartate/methionine/tyrosine aminotransferase
MKSKVFITPGMVFGENGVRHIRISLCGSVDLFKEAHQRIQHALKVKENRLENR